MRNVIITDKDKTDIEPFIYNWVFQDKKNESFLVSEIVEHLGNHGIDASPHEVKKTLQQWSDSGLVYSNMDGYHVSFTN
jgi:Fe2+ or Zn2+ uptake regulation protein